MISLDNLLIEEKGNIIINIYNQDNKYSFGKESIIPGLDVNYKMNARPGGKQDLACRAVKEAEFEMKWDGGKSHGTTTASVHSQPFGPVVQQTLALQIRKKYRHFIGN